MLEVLEDDTGIIFMVKFLLSVLLGYVSTSENIQREEIVSREIYLSGAQKIVYQIEVSGK